MPSKGYLWNLSHWVTKLGFNRQDQPEIGYSVQPVQVVGDASALTSPLLPPLAWSGGLVPAVAGRVGGIAITSRAPGGTFIRTLRASANLGDWVWTVDAGKHAFTAVQANPPLRQMGPENVTALVEIGTTLVPLNSNVHPNVLNTSDLGFFSDEFYLPPSGQIYMENSTVNSVLRFAVLIQDCPAMVPAA